MLPPPMGRAMGVQLRGRLSPSVIAGVYVPLDCSYGMCVCTPARVHIQSESKGR